MKQLGDPCAVPLCHIDFKNSVLAIKGSVVNHRQPIRKRLPEFGRAVADRIPHKSGLCLRCDNPSSRRLGANVLKDLKAHKSSSPRFQEELEHADPLKGKPPNTGRVLVISGGPSYTLLSLGFILIEQHRICHFKPVVPCGKTISLLRRNLSDT